MNDHRAVPRAADADAAADARVEAIAGLREREPSRVRAAVPRFRIGDIQRVGLLVDVHPARAAELEPLGDELPVLIEDLNAVVLTIADEHASARIDGERVRDIELARAHAFLAPRLEELSVLVELHDARVADRQAAAGVAVGDEDVAV